MIIMIILAPYSLKVSKERRYETDCFLRSISNKYKIIRKQTEQPSEYELFINEYWQQDDIIILEHDLVPTEKDLEELIKCKYYICSFNYYLYQCSTLLKYPVIANRKIIYINNLINYEWIKETDDFCDLSSLGFIKINKEIQYRIDLKEIINNSIKRKNIKYDNSIQSSGINFDYNLSNEFFKLNKPIHIHHKLIKHNHA